MYANFFVLSLFKYFLFMATFRDSNFANKFDNMTS